MAEFRMPSLGADMEAGTLLEWRVQPGDAVRRGDIVAVVDTSKAEIEVEIFEDGVIDELLVSEGTRVPVGTVLATVRTGEGAATTAATTAATAGATARATAGATAATVQPPAAPAAPAAREPQIAAPAPPPAAPAPPPAAPAPPPAAPPAPPAAAAGAPAAHAAAAAPAHHLRVSPVARRAAESLGVDLATVAGSGPDGAITKADVERRAAFGGATAAAAPVAEREPAAPAPAPGTPEPGEAGDRQAAMRQAIGALMARSKREIPHYYLQSQIDMSRALAWLAEENAGRGVSERLLPSALLTSAVARATAQTPAMNGFWVDGAFRAGSGVHLGVAIALRGGGLIAPALHDADRMSLDELMAGLRDLVQRARSGRLRSSEMSDPTITLTNLGERAVDLVHGVIYPPQVALVGFGGIRERPWAVDGMLGVRPIVHATLAADHRASDGHAGSRFLALIDRLLQTPEEL